MVAGNHSLNSLLNSPLNFPWADMAPISAPPPEMPGHATSRTGPGCLHWRWHRRSIVGVAAAIV
jgi:hypothetical protein